MCKCNCESLLNLFVITFDDKKNPNVMIERKYVKNKTTVALNEKVSKVIFGLLRNAENNRKVKQQ